MTAILPTKSLTAHELADVLESGQYHKGVGRLLEYDEYCCLGVYAKECGFLQHDGATGYVDDDGFSSTGKLEGMAPAWMHETYIADGEVIRIEDRLISINDDSQTFEPVIDFLRTL